jgi:hypothetical protein
VATYTYAQMMTLWIEAGGKEALAPLAAAIGTVESGGNSQAHNPSGASGIWQIEVPLHDAQIPGGAGNVFSPEANAVAAVRVSGNSLAGLTSNWIVDEPPGAAQAVLEKNKGTKPHGVPSQGKAGGTSETPAALQAQGGLSFSNIISETSIPGIALPDPLSIFKGTASTVGDIGTAIEGLVKDTNTALHFLAVLGKPSFWLRMGAFIVGVISAGVGVYFLGKSIGVSGPKAPTIMPIPV